MFIGKVVQQSQLSSHHNEHTPMDNQKGSTFGITINNSDVISFFAAPTKHYRPEMRKKLVKDVHCMLSCISVKWDNIGQGLDVDWNYREELRGKPEKSDYKLESVLYKWSESECSVVHWDTIIEVLEKLQLMSVQTSVKRYLLNDPEAVQKYSWTEK